MLIMGVDLVRSLQPPDILWIHWGVYNSIANTSKGVLFLPPSDVYVRSFLYLLYTWIKLYYTKALSNPASSLALDWTLFLWRPRIPESFCGSTTTFQHGTTDWFQIGKGVCQGYILSPCLLNLYAEYIMRNARLDEGQAGIKIAGRNINNLRYAEDTTNMDPKMN